jgi:hypothetical protein
MTELAFHFIHCLDKIEDMTFQSLVHVIKPTLCDSLY